MIRISCRIFPTENEERIAGILSKEFPGFAFSRSGYFLEASADGREALADFRRRIFEKRILDTVRSRLIANSSAGGTHILLHKQALAAGRIAIIDSDSESPLGAVRISVGSEDLDSFINWLSPRTVDGIPLESEGD